MLRFVRANNDFSDTLPECPRFRPPPCLTLGVHYNTAPSPGFPTQAVWYHMGACVPPSIFFPCL
jgi:hypothetical protein